MLGQVEDVGASAGAGMPALTKAQDSNAANSETRLYRGDAGLTYVNDCFT